MLTYEWISMITLGKGRWDTRHHVPKPYETEREAARLRHEAGKIAVKASRQAAKPASPGLLQRLFSRRRARLVPQPPRREPPHKQASRA